MPLSDDLRNELAAIAPRRGWCRLAEISAVFHSAGSVHLRGRGEVALHLDLVSSAVARRAFSLQPAKVSAFSALENRPWLRMGCAFSKA